MAEPPANVLEYSSPHKHRDGWSFKRYVIVIACTTLCLTLLLLYFDVFRASRGPSNRVHCASNMRQIGQLLHMYANDHDRALPDSLATLMSGTYFDAKVFCCPSSMDLPSSAKTPEQLTQDFIAGGHLSYIFIPGALTHPTTLPFQGGGADVPILYEPLANHHGDGMNVLFLDGHVEFVTSRDAKNLTLHLKSDTTVTPQDSQSPP